MTPRHCATSSSCCSGCEWRHQVDQIAAGHTPGDVITMSELSPLNRSLLNDGLREIVGVQRRVRNVGVLPG